MTVIRSTSVPAAPSVLDACSAQFLAALPSTLTDAERALARTSFDGGARAVVQLLIGMEALALSRGDPPLDLARVGRLIGLTDGPLVS